MSRGRHRRVVVLVLRWRYTLTLLVLVLALLPFVVHGFVRDHDCRERGGVPVRGGCAQPVLEAP